MSELSEADRFLLEQIRQGSADGWRQLVERYQGRLAAFARGRLGSDADAEDAVQETFLSFLKGLPNYREQASLETYLFTILRRRILDEYRGRPVNVCSLQDTFGTTDHDASGGGDMPIASRQPTASWYARRDEEQERLAEALERSLGHFTSHLKQTENFRNLQIAELLLYAQLPNRQVAAELDMNERQIAVLKHRFLHRIAERVGERDRPNRSASTTPDESVRTAVFAHEALLTQIWEDMRPSCPKRSTIGAFLLGTLDDPWRTYVDFHLNRLGCRFCGANLDDLQRRTEQINSTAFRQRIMQSTIGFLQKP